MVSAMGNMFPISEIRRVAAELQCDPRSVEAELSGRRVRGMVGERIRRYLTTRGVLPAQAEASVAHASALLGARHRGGVF
jgi:hypothetical protein